MYYKGKLKIKTQAIKALNIDRNNDKADKCFITIVSFSRYQKTPVVLCLLMASFLLALLIPVAALADNNLKMTITSTKVVFNGAGETTYVPVKSASEGSLVQYRANFFNTSNEALFDTTITLPIPTNTLFTGEAFPQSVQASSDYYNYQDLPIKRMNNGKLETVPLSEYKSLRWNIKFLPPKKSVTVTFNTIVK